MKIEAILALEASNIGEIHLVRDRLFWQAWEGSAFLFSKQVRPYKVHHRFYQKVGQDLVWLGFPKTALVSLEAEIKELGLALEWDGDDHAVIRGMAALDGFDLWKRGVIGQAHGKETKFGVAVVGAPIERVQPGSGPVTSIPSSEDRWLPAYRHAYDLALHIFRACAKVGKEYKYSLAEHLRNSMTEIVESLHLLVSHLATDDVVVPCLRAAQRVRIQLRLLKDLRQVSLKQWGFLNAQLEVILNLLWPESHPSRLVGAMPFQSSDPLASG